MLQPAESGRVVHKSILSVRLRGAGAFRKRSNPMRRLTTTFAVLALASSAILPSLAQDRAANPNGVFVDDYGTSFTFSLCGDGTDLCGVLNDVQGNSRTQENLAYVNQQVMQAELVSENQWKGTVIFGGQQASATVTQTGPDTVEIQGCRGGLFCQTLEFNRV
jgi:hypothetical protein